MGIKLKRRVSFGKEIEKKNLKKLTSSLVLKAVMKIPFVGPAVHQMPTLDAGVREKEI